MKPLPTLLFVALVAVGAGYWMLHDPRAPGGPPQGGTSPDRSESGTLQEGTGPSATDPTDAAEPAQREAGAVVRGRVVDTDGRGFRELRVALRGVGEEPRTARTDAEGAFAFRALHPGPYELDLTDSFDASQLLGQRMLACALEPLALELADEQDLDVGTHVLPRSRPCWILGRVVVDEEWARSKGVWLGDVRLEVETPSLDEMGDDVLPVVVPHPGAPADWSAPPWRRDLPPAPALEADGGFRFAVEAPHDAFVLRARWKRFEPAETLVRPTPDGVIEVTLALPPQ